MFPVDWSEDKIKSEIKSAWSSKNFRIEVGENGKSWHGTSKSGVKMTGFINKEKIGDKVIEKVTAYPLYKGEI